jgi:hypothetical protein
VFAFAERMIKAPFFNETDRKLPSDCLIAPLHYSRLEQVSFGLCNCRLAWKLLNGLRWQLGQVEASDKSPLSVGERFAC